MCAGGEAEVRRQRRIQCWSVTSRTVTVQQWCFKCVARGAHTELSDEALDTDNEDVDPSFDPHSSMRSDKEHILDSFCDNRITSLRWQDRALLGLFLSFQLSTITGKRETEAAELAGQMIGKFDRTVREWRSKFFESDGELPESKEGQYWRTGVLWRNEFLNRKVTRFIRANAAVKKQANLTVSTFCQ